MNIYCLKQVIFKGYKPYTTRFRIFSSTCIEGLALRGLDILGAAKTGSGKTLAFIIPIIGQCNHLNLIISFYNSDNRSVQSFKFNNMLL